MCSRSSFAGKVITDIDRDAIDPSTKVFAGPKTREVFKDSKINLLGRVTRIVAVAEHPPRNRYDTPLSRQHDSLECEAVARPRTCYQGCQIVGPRLLVSGRRHFIVCKNDVSNLSNHASLGFPIITTPGTRKSLRSFSICRKRRQNARTFGGIPLMLLQLRRTSILSSDGATETSHFPTRHIPDSKNPGCDKRL